MNRIAKCPHCGSNSGLFVKVTLANVVDYYDFNGNFQCEDLENSDYRYNKMMYCKNCEKYIMKFEDYQRDYLQDNK